MSDVQAPAPTPTPTGSNADLVRPAPAATVVPPLKAPPAAQAEAEVQAPDQAPAAEEWFEVPVDGKKIRMTKKELLAQASLAKAAHKRFEEASQMRKTAEDLLGRLRNPKDAIKLLNDPKLGLDQAEVQAAFEDWYAESVIKRSQMTPEQLRLADLEQELNKYKESEKAKQEEQERLQNEQLDAQTRKQLEQEAIDILNSEGLPKNKFTVSRMAHWTRINEMKGFNAPKEVLAQQVRQELRSLVDSLLQASEGEVLANLVGESTIKKIRKHDIEQLRKSRNVQSAPEQQSQQDSDKPKQIIRPDEVRRRMREMF